jgi:hypothetical protein
VSDWVVDGLGDPLTSDNAEPLNLRSGVPQTVPVKRLQNSSTAIIVGQNHHSEACHRLGQALVASSVEGVRRVRIEKGVL